MTLPQTAAQNVPVVTLDVFRGTVGLVAAHLAQNPMDAASVPGFIRSIAAELTAVAAGQQVSLPAPAPVAAAPAPAPARIEAPKAPAKAPEPKVVAEAPAAEVKDRFSHLARKPFVKVSESVTNDEIICLFDGVGKKMLKRYIRAKYGMEENDYKAHFGLPADYPMVAPGYASEKAMVAISQGLGTSKVSKEPKVVAKAKRQLARVG